MTENLGSMLETYTSEALAWLIADGFLKSVKPTATRNETYTYIVSTECVKRDGSKLKFVFYYNQQNGSIGG